MNILSYYLATFICFLNMTANGSACCKFFSLWCAILLLDDQLHRLIRNGYIETRIFRILASGPLNFDISRFDCMKFL